MSQNEKHGNCRKTSKTKIKTKFYVHQPSTFVYTNRKKNAYFTLNVKKENAVPQNSANSEVTPWKKVLLKL